MLRGLVSAFATEKQKRALRRWRSAAKNAFANTFRAYDAGDLKAALRDMGIDETDTLLVHANLRPDSGFRGTPNDLVSALIDVVGDRGTLLMVSQPFRGYAYDYLRQGRRFDVNRTVSMMGLVTEMFRRRAGTLRSLHPTHPVLAYGKRSAEIIAGHENCLFPCGSGTPFEKFREMNGKILYLDVGTGANTFFHHVEDKIKDRLSFPLYAEELFTVAVTDRHGKPSVVRTYAFDKGVVRHTDRLEEQMGRQGKISKKNVGNSRLTLVDAKDVVAVMTEMVNAGELLIEPPAR